MIQFGGNIREVELIDFPQKKKPVMQYFFDSDEHYSKLNKESYDIIISSHVLEHLANPIKTLYKWKSLLKCGGILCLVVPHKDYTFDWKREITSIDHLIRDYKLDIGEDDTTHFQEVIDLHDIKMDSNVLDPKNHYNRTLNNYNLRVVHHHTFNFKSVEILCDYLGLNKIDSFFIKPYNIFYLFKK